MIPHTERLDEAMDFLFVEYGSWVEEIYPDPLTFAIFDHDGTLIANGLTPEAVIQFAQKHGFDQAKLQNGEN